ncbi:MAG: hypothetical protein SGCHY_004530 [Lobulomycetales sp.]
MQAAVERFQSLQKEHTAAINNRGTLQAQLDENTSVLKELEAASNKATFKLTGPVLLPIDTPEAVSNVKKRLEFIKGEIARLEGVIQDLDGKMDKERDGLMQMQQQQQQEQAAAQQQQTA